MIAGRLGRTGLVLALIVAACFGVAAPPERCPSPTAAELRDSAQASVDWFVRNQLNDGRWVYLYDAGDDAISPEYNEVRHAGVTMGLYQAAAAGLPGAVRSADRGTKWALERLIERRDWAAVDYGGVSTGATALLAAGLTFRREATQDGRYDALLRRLGRFLIAQTEPSGAVLASYDLTDERPVPREYSKYYTGEAYWALARLDSAFPGEGWGAAADRIGAYLASSRDEVEDHWPPVPDHWAAYGTAERVESGAGPDLPLTEPEVAYARRQAELFGAQARWVAQRFGPWGALVRGTYTPRGGGYGVIDEALTGWWLTAGSEPRLADLREPLADRATCVAGLALEAQSDSDDAADSPRPRLAEGAWFNDGETRMDDQQHALDGLLRTIPIVEARAGSAPESSGSDDEAPSAWLWAAVLVLLLNPARAALGVPRAGRSPGEVARVAALGGVIGGVAVCAAAAAGEPLLDALDVSEPSFRTAAGIVAALAGAIDLVRAPPSPQPALPGRRAALVPVAVPLVARPALLVTALGAGAEQGVPLAAAAMTVAVLLLSCLAVRSPTDGAAGRALRWASRLLAAGLIAGGILLTIDGVLDV